MLKFFRQPRDANLTKFG